MRILATSALVSVVELSSRCDTLTRSAGLLVMLGGGAWVGQAVDVPKAEFHVPTAGTYSGVTTKASLLRVRVRVRARAL